MSRAAVSSRRASARTCGEQETTPEQGKGLGPGYPQGGVPIEFCKQLNTGVLEYRTKLKFLENKEDFKDNIWRKL